jgi:hypothetical protein
MANESNGSGPSADHGSVNGDDPAPGDGATRSSASSAWTRQVLSVPKAELERRLEQAKREKSLNRSK